MSVWALILLSCGSFVLGLWLGMKVSARMLPRVMAGLGQEGMRALAQRAAEIREQEGITD